MSGRRAGGAAGPHPSLGLKDTLRSARCLTRVCPARSTDGLPQPELTGELQEAVPTPPCVYEVTVK